MNSAWGRSRQFVLAILVLLAAAWTSGEAAQWLVRWRAERLLADIRSLEVNRSQWSDVQPVMHRWGQWSTLPGPCTAQACNYRINFEQTLPPMLVGTPGGDQKNWLAIAIDRIGLRSVAVHAGFTVQRGVLTAKWFGEQVTPPVQDWASSTGYIPYLSVLSGESLSFHSNLGDPPKLHPNRMVQPINNYIVVSFTPDETPSEKAALMDFQLTCITQFSPCLSERDILPEGWRMLQEQMDSPHTR